MKGRSRVPGALGQRGRIIKAAKLALLRRTLAKHAVGAEPPIFVVGSGRSGNTLVRRVLMATGDIYIPPETFVLGDIIEGWARSSLLPWRERVWLFCAHFEKHHFFSTFGLENLNAFSEEAIAWPTDRRNIRHLIEGFYGYLAQAHGSAGRRWGDKTPYNTFHLDALDAVFPDARYIWLVRDGRDVVLSYVQAGLFDSYADAARRWVDANRRCQEFSDRKGNMHRVRYEDLVHAPETGFAALCAWANLPFSPEMLSADVGPMGDVESLDHHRNVAGKISASSVGRWREHLSASDLSRLPGDFREMQDRLGYETGGPRG